VRKTFTLACVWLWVVGVCRLSRYLPKCRYLDGKCSRLQRYDLFPFFSPPDAKTRLRRVHYGPKIAWLGSALAVVESNSRLQLLNPLFV